MEKKLFRKIIIVLIAMAIGIIFYSTKSYANGFENNFAYVEGESYEVRCGDKYFETLEILSNNSWIIQPSSQDDVATIEFLTEEITVSKNINFYFNTRFAHFKSQGPDDPYNGHVTSGKTLLKRAEGYTGALFSSNNGLFRFENLIIDGGWNDDKSGMEAQEALVILNGQTDVEFSNCILRNNCNRGTSGGGGAIYSGSSNGTVTCKNVTITNCLASEGGAMSLGNVTLVYEGGSVSKCYSTSPVVKNSSAISTDPSNDSYTLTMKNVTVTDCCALNATIGGAAVGTTDFGIWHLDHVTITNNYSSAGKAGFAMAEGDQGNMSTINVDGDIFIDNNYAYCTFDGYTPVTQGIEANMCIEQDDVYNIYINTDMTEATSCGITVWNQSIVTGDLVIFGTADPNTKGLDRFFSDEDNWYVGQSYGVDDVVFVRSPDAPPLEPTETEKETLTLKHLSKGNYVDITEEYTFRIKYTLEGVETEKDVDLSHEGTYSLEIDKGTNFSIELIDRNDDIWEVTTEAPTENSPINIDQANGIVSGVIDVDGEVIVTYINTRERSPETGITDNVFPLLIMLVVAVMLFIINKKMKMIKQ